MRIVSVYFSFTFVLMSGSALGELGSLAGEGRRCCSLLILSVHPSFLLLLDFSFPLPSFSCFFPCAIC